MAAACESRNPGLIAADRFALGIHHDFLKLFLHTHRVFRSGRALA